MSDLKRKIIIKTRILIVLVALVISGFSFASVYANAVSFVLNPSKTIVKRGEKITLIAKTKDIDQLDGGFNGYSGTLGYDPAVISRNDSKTAISGWTIAYNATNQKFVGSDPTGVDFKTNDLDVIAFEFTVLESAPSGTTTIRLSDLKLSDKNYKAINAGNASVEITIIDQDVQPEKSNNSKLQELKPSTGVLSPQFDPKRTDYTIDVGENTDSISFLGATQDQKGKVILGNNSHPLTTGENKIEIVVEAEDGTKTTYTVIVNKPKKSLKPDEPNNDKNPTGGDSDKDTQKPNDNNKDVKNKQNSNINVDNNSNSSNNYVINVDGLGNILDGFDPKSNNHTSYVGKETVKLEPVVILEDKNASYEIIGADKLKVGNNIVKLVVTAANGDKREYVFNVVRSSEENTSTLASLSVGGYALNPGFRPDVNYYSMIVDSNTHALGVSAASTHGGAVVNITGNDHLKTGVNLIKISVDSNYHQNTYVIEVIKEAEPEKFNFIPWIITALSVLIAIALLIVIHYKNKMIMMKEEKNQAYDPVLLHLLNQNQQIRSEINHRRGEQNE